MDRNLERRTMGRKVKRVLVLSLLNFSVSYLTKKKCLDNKRLWIHSYPPSVRIPIKSLTKWDRLVFKLFLFSYHRDIGDMNCIITYINDNEGYGLGFVIDGKICHSLSKFLNSSGYLTLSNSLYSYVKQI